MEDFCAWSGHRINSRKTNIFLSKGVDDNMVNLISTVFSFQRVHNLGHYLGVPLFHQRVTSSTMQFVVEKVHSKLQSWEARKLSFDGRITLAQSILLSIPSYFMQSMMIPRKTCDEIESLVKQFIWETSERRRKMSLVNWDTICQPKMCGGLGLRKLKDQNISFLMKLGFKLVSDKEAFWVRVVRSKYQMNDKLPECVDRNGSSFLWKSLSKIWTLFRESIHWSIGDGRKIRCWKDNWIPHLGPLLRYTPSNFNLNTDCTLREMAADDGSWNIGFF
ncbi:hypothetical protein J1N35_028496 [Gossypium stocksii]|uniref:Reverse transcriptase zinc-binding domain-containing protein n=1 Tax=Gossypium stocksii TaxID=47602 RepID=A0A9D3UWT5_9ROSI|nr:hypothetical protein J1N35_028496 [Gossypium stocksii]